MIRSIKLGCVLSIALGVAGVANAQSSPGGAAPGQAATYVVDGRALGSRLASDSSLRDYKCSPSEQFSGFTWCQRTNRTSERRGAFEATTSVLHAKDGTIVYVSRHQQPAFLDAAAAEREIQKYTGSFGASPKIAKMPRRPGGVEATIATWGAVELEPLDGDSVKLVAEGKSPKKGFLIDYLGNLARSAQEGLPIYRLVGGAGFAWAASVDARARGALRLVAIDASALQPAPAVATAPPVSPPAGGDAAQIADPPAPAQPKEPTVAARLNKPPAPARPSEPTVTARLVEPTVTARPDPDVTIAQLQLELASAREEKAGLERARAQAEEGARQARTQAAIAREEMEQARNAANVASEEIDRLKQAVAAPSSSFGWSNAALIAVGAAAILGFGVWLGSSRKKAMRPASGDVDGSTEIDVVARTEAVEGLPPPSEQMASIDQDGLVRELGRRLGLEEVAAPLPTAEHATPLATEELKASLPPEELTAPLSPEELATPLEADVLSGDDPKPAFQPEAAAPPMAAVVPPEPVLADAGAKLDAP
jgi:hypothetical protein